MQTTSTAPAPRRNSLDEYIRLMTEPTAPVCGMGHERAAIATAGLAGEIASSTVFARFSFNAKAGL